jgi:predicted nucleotidyltransferase
MIDLFINKTSLIMNKTVFSTNFPAKHQIFVLDKRARSKMAGKRGSEQNKREFEKINF